MTCLRAISRRRTTRVGHTGNLFTLLGNILSESTANTNWHCEGTSGEAERVWVENLEDEEERVGTSCAWATLFAIFVTHLTAAY